MATGILGQFAPSAATNTTVYTVPSAKIATFNINIVNRNTAVATIRIGVSATGTPGNTEWIEYGAQILANGGILERTGLVAQAAKNVVVFSDVASTSVTVYGYEE
jgi:hypothetical protein